MIAVMIPLHVDATLPASDAVSSDALDACVDCVGNELGRQLQPVAAEEWPELRQLYVDCVLLDVEGTDEKSYRFDSKYGQLAVNRTVDCRPLLDASVEEQALAVLDGVAAVAAKAFAKRSRPRLANAVEDFRRQLNVEFIRQCRDMAADEADDVAPMADEPVPRDAEGRIRHLRALPDQPGELWVMATPASAPLKFEAAIAEIERHALASGLGQPNGSAVGSEAFDLSFDVESLADAGAELDRFLRAALPQLDYLISDDYEPILEEKDRDLG